MKVYENCSYQEVGQWDCSDAPCEKVGWVVIAETGERVCTRHLGYAVEAYLVSGLLSKVPGAGVTIVVASND